LDKDPIKYGLRKGRAFIRPDHQTSDLQIHFGNMQGISKGEQRIPFAVNE
jgi:cold shock CspA family protein